MCFDLVSSNDKQKQSKNGAFVVHPMYVDSQEGIESFLGMIRQIGGQRLLPRKAKKETTDAGTAEEGEDVDGGDEDKDKTEKTVVRSSSPCLFEL